MRRDDIPNLVKDLLNLEKKYDVTLLTDNFYLNLKQQVDGINIPEYGNSNIITPNARAYISDLEESTGIKFNGSTALDASNYIEANKNKITLKQKEYIHMICTTLGIICEATTKEQATQFINQYKPAFNLIRRLVHHYNI